MKPLPVRADRRFESFPHRNLNLRVAHHNVAVRVFGRLGGKIVAGNERNGGRRLERGRFKRGAKSLRRRVDRFARKRGGGRQKRLFEFVDGA